MRTGTLQPRRFAEAGLDRILCHDAKRGLLEVQSGTPWSALADHGGAAFAPGTVGASAAMNAAGPDGRPVVAHLRAFTLVTADGELRRASRDSTPELFRLAVGGFGVFGPFYSLTLDLASLSRAAAAAAAPVFLKLPGETPAQGSRCGVELLVPPEAAEGYIAQARAALGDRPCTLDRLEARYALPEEETFLRWARREYAVLRIECRFRPTLGASANALQLCAQLIELALATGGAVAPASLPLASRAQAQACYPMLGAFLAEKRRYDPAERVWSAWYRGTRDLLRREPCTARWSRG
jgi:FAD/FMN-containing dehydrogenase